MKEVDLFKENTGLSLHEQYMRHHPQVLSGFEVEIPTLVWPMNSGSIHCAAGSLRRDPEPKE